MKLGSAGGAFFVEPSSERIEEEDQRASSPILSENGDNEAAEENENEIKGMH